MKTVALPSGEKVPAFGMGAWNIGDSAGLAIMGIGGLVAFIAGCVAYVGWCDRIVGRDEQEHA